MAMVNYIKNNLGVKQVLSNPSNPTVSSSVLYESFYKVPINSEVPSIINVGDLTFVKKHNDYDCNEGNFFVASDENNYNYLLTLYNWKKSDMIPNAWYISNPDSTLYNIQNLWINKTKTIYDDNISSEFTYAFKKNEYEFSCLNCLSSNEWEFDTNSNSHYYVNESTNNTLSESPSDIFVNNVKYEKVSENSTLQQGQWKWAKDPSNTYYTVWVNDGDSIDIDDRPMKYIKASTGQENNTLYVYYTGPDITSEFIDYIIADTGDSSKAIYIKWNNSSILTKEIFYVNADTVLTVDDNFYFINLSTLIHNSSDIPINYSVEVEKSNGDIATISSGFILPNNNVNITDKFILQESDMLKARSSTGLGTIIISGVKNPVS